MAAIGEPTVTWFTADRPAPAAEAAPPSATAVAELVQTYSGLLYRVALSVLRNPVEAEDVVQDAFLRVLQHQRTLPEVAEFRPWLVRIAWNLALDRRRRIRPGQMDPAFAAALVARDLPADAALAQAHLMQAALAAIDRLPAREREVLLLSAMDELTPAEISAITGRTESAVRSLLFRARTRLRQRLTPPGGTR